MHDIGKKLLITWRGEANPKKKKKSNCIMNDTMIPSIEHPNVAGHMLIFQLQPKTRKKKKHQ